ncbi:uncharacterized protein LOC114525355 isoform X2 [Dendronephthya gigantea]|uniref:uncharacterized protein LOC114525355 isoform X2 n=1 Tax=Dendronephthya gigantea TaxID=151771 RepID=UPI0010694DD5|nr:uncharacterized protein LOC114525355 isoform X2 [Dendronephthya gigantea]
MKIGVHDVQSKVVFIAKKEVMVNFVLPRNVNGTYGGVRMKYRRIPKDVCKSSYETFEIEDEIQSPGFPDNIGANSSCEYYIDVGPFSLNDVIQIRFRELSFGPDDTLTVYDAKSNTVIFGPLIGPQRLIRANTTKSTSVKIVVETKFVPSIKQRYFILFREVPRDSCVLDYTGDYGGKFSSLDRPCVYNIRLKHSIQLDFKLNGLYVPSGGLIKVIQRSKYSEDTTLLSLDNDDTGKTRYFRNDPSHDVIEISASEHVRFTVRFKRFKKDTTITLRNPNGTILSPYYPYTYHFKAFADSTYTYHIEVPKGRVRLNFTKLSLYVENRYLSDDLFVYDGKSRDAYRIWLLRTNEKYQLPLSLLSSGNHLTVVFRPMWSPKWKSVKGHVFQFEAIYSSEFQVKDCIAFDWPHSRAERNVTLPGRETKFFCNKNYVSGSYFKDVTRRCGFHGEWEEGRTLNCLRVCPPLDEKLKENSSLSWWYSTFSKGEVYDGVYAYFSCNYYKEQLVGPKTITCTSHGNYTALPPICKRKPKRNSDYGSIRNFQRHKSCCRVW